jgi:hypothetical protein
LVLIAFALLALLIYDSLGESQELSHTRHDAKTGAELKPWASAEEISHSAEHEAELKEAA